MTAGDYRILLVDDDSEGTLSLARALKAAGLNSPLELASCVERAREKLGKFDPHVALIDLSLNDHEGIESGFALLDYIGKRHPLCRVIVLTGNGGLQNGIRALNQGAVSFLEKPADPRHVAALIREAASQSLMRREFEAFKCGREERALDQLLTGQSVVMQRVREIVSYAARTSQPVLITGETGSGKGLCALAIHRFSSRAGGKFVRYQPNFASADLANSDLFGHTRGAFTGAHAERPGLMAEATAGTLFLDEIEDLPNSTQVALLGVLQDQKFRPLGSDKEQTAAFRLICACNGDVPEALRQGRLRQDFYHRVAHLEIMLPPLRERLEDIPDLGVLFLQNLREREEVRVFDLARSALQKLKSFDWPGNVRQLQAVLEGGAYRAHFAGRGEIEADDLRLPAEKGGNGKPGGSFHDQVEAFKIRLIETALVRNGRSQLKAARELSLDRSTLRRILSRAGG